MSKSLRPALRRRISLFVGAALVCAVCPLVFASAQSRAPVKTPYSSEELFALGSQRVFEGRNLKEVAFPLGGIGTGTVSLGGRGNLRDWEIFNRPGKGINLPFTFFALYCQDSGGRSNVRVLEGPLTPPYTGPDGIKRTEVPGLPRMEKARFFGEYPLARVEMSDGRLPLQVTLEAFNPFIPLDPEASGIPAVLLRFRIRNLSSNPVKLTVAGSIMNPIGFDGEGDLGGLGNEKLGQNVNLVRRTPSLSGLFLTSKKVAPDSSAFGTMALVTPLADITYVSHWERGDWWDDLQIFWDDFSKDGRLKDLSDDTPSPDKSTDVGSLGVTASVDPFGETTIPFVLAWNFPNVKDYFDIVQKQRGSLFRNHYAARFADAWAAAEYLVRNLPELERRTRLFHDALFSSTLPPHVLDALSSQMSIIRTTTCLWLEGQGFFGFEGCNDKSGCCPLNCAHVWNYEQSLAFLFPSLERSMRETDFLNQVKPDGGMVFRTSLPLHSGAYWDFKPAADGQMGRIISLYRDWQLSGDNAFLKKLWPDAKRALEYAWTSWDADRDGLMEGEQHNTYDIEFYGPNSMMGGFYLGALLAGSKMAAAMGDAAAAEQYRQVFEKGRQKYNDLLWNGEYYVQKYDQVMEKKYQYGEGCLSDQMLGQWLSMMAGLGRFLPEDRLKTTLESVYRYNFRTDFRDYSNVQRTYVLNDEKGLLLCSWPRGGRPPLPFVYSDEVWTGIEYHVASHLMFEGLLEEGLSIVEAARDRYDGWRRNPWDEVECGHHYARAMSSWGLLIALSGFSYSGVDMRLGFEPRLYAEDFRTLWTTGSGWGTYGQQVEKAGTLTARLSAAAGELKLRQLSFLLPPVDQGKAIVEVRGTLGKKTFKPRPSRDGDHVVVNWERPVVVKPGEDLMLEVEF
jgi:non-lysosomal glucosylceramidase